MINNCAKVTSGKAFFIKGQPYWGSALTLIDNQASGSLKAIDVTSGKIKWEVATRSPMVAGVLATAGGLVFTGDAEGYFTAYDAATGKDLWTFQCGSGHHSGPITYTLDGRQYIAVCVGWGGWTAGFAGDGAPGSATPGAGNPLRLRPARGEEGDPSVNAIARAPLTPALSPSGRGRPLSPSAAPSRPAEVSTVPFSPPGRRCPKGG